MDHATRIWLMGVLGAYLLGAVPFGLLIGLARGVDIRQQGSGNIGATNLGRALGKKWGILCFVCDLGKGLLPVLGYSLVMAGAPGLVSTLQWTLVGVAAVLGHIFPIYLKFRGGKGVATGLGVVLGFWPTLTAAGLVAAVLWLILAKRTGYVSLASVAAALSLPITTAALAWAWQVDPGQAGVFVGITLLLAALVAVRHRANLVRLRAGTESRAKWASNK